MKKNLTRSLVVAAWVPMLCVFWLVAASRWEKMDVVTMKLPQFARHLVANAAIADRFNHSRDRRAVLLDPSNAQAWNDYCDDFEETANNQEPIHRCQVAVSLGPTARNLQDLGGLQLETDPCAAETSFKRSQDLEAKITAEGFISTMAAFWRGVAARKCGDLAGARDAFTTVLARDELVDKNPKIIDQTRNTNAPSQHHEDMSAILFELHEDGKATVECQIAHPDFKPACLCRFGLTAAGVICADRADRFTRLPNGDIAVIDERK